GARGQAGGAGKVQVASSFAKSVVTAGPQRARMTAAVSRAWARSPHAEGCRRGQVELPDLPGVQSRRVSGEILALIDSAYPCLPVLLHGEGHSGWTGERLALGHRQGSRVGSASSLPLPAGTP